MHVDRPPGESNRATIAVSSEPSVTAQPIETVCPHESRQRQCQRQLSILARIRNYRRDTQNGDQRRLASHTIHRARNVFMLPAITRTIRDIQPKRHTAKKKNQD